MTRGRGIVVMTTPQLPAVVEPAQLTAALRRSGVLDAGAVREVKVLHERDTQQNQESSLQAIAGRPVFRIIPPHYVTDDLVEFVAQRLKATSGSHA